MTDYSSHPVYKILTQEEFKCKDNKFSDKKYNTQYLLTQYFKNTYKTDTEINDTKDQLLKLSSTFTDPKAKKPKEFFTLHKRLNLLAERRTLSLMKVPENISAIIYWHNEYMVRELAKVDKITEDTLGDVLTFDQ